MTSTTNTSTNVEDNVLETFQSMYGKRKGDIHNFYNALDCKIQLYDIRNANEYLQCHIRHATNIDPSTIMQLDSFASTFHPIYIYSGKKNIPTEIIDHLYSIAKEHFKEKHLNFCYLNDCCFADFQECYPFLCESESEIQSESNDLKIDSESNDMQAGLQSQTVIYPNVILANELYLGDGFMVEEKDVLINLHIQYILSVTKCCFMIDKPTKEKNNIQIMKLEIDDDSFANMEQHFESGTQFIESAAQNKKRVFVHCMAGVSRSATIVIAYLMKYREMNLFDAYLHVLQSRSKIHPNEGFLAQLEKYEMKLYSVSTAMRLRKILKIIRTNQ